MRTAVHEVDTRATEILQQQEATIVQAKIRSEETATDDVTMEAQPRTPEAPIETRDEQVDKADATVAAL